MKLEGRVALVTGSARGIGKDIARVLLEKGAKVSISDANDKVGKATYEEFKKKHGDNVMYTNCDVRSEEAMADTFKKTFEKYKRLDVVVNNAGILNESKWEESMDINLKGTVHGTNLAIRYMRKDKGGHGGVIVNVSSTAGLNSFPAAPCYAATKHGIVGFTKSWTVVPWIIENGIRMNCFCPGCVDTDFSKNLAVDHIIESAIFNMEVLSKIPRITVEQTSEGILKLLEDEDNNGRCLKMDFEEDKLVTQYVD